MESHVVITYYVIRHGKGFFEKKIKFFFFLASPTR